MSRSRVLAPPHEDPHDAPDAPPLPHPDLLPPLPGEPGPRMFDLYGGFLNVDVPSGRQLYYLHATALTDPDDKPLMLWLNGGPGCSSLIGFFSELGPYYPNADGASLQPAWHTWLAEVNLLVIESPALVGFSTSSDPRDAVVGDERTARDLVRALLSFYHTFPQYQGRKLILAGESYGGVSKKKKKKKKKKQMIMIIIVIIMRARVKVRG